MGAEEPAPGGLVGHLDGFVRAVRAAGVPVGITQAVDAAEILTLVDLLDREQLRHGLAAVLLRRAAQRPTFDTLFDLWWPLADRPASGDAEGPGGEPGQDAGATLDLPADGRSPSGHQRSNSTSYVGRWAARWSSTAASPCRSCSRSSRSTTVRISAASTAWLIPTGMPASRTARTKPSR